MRSREETAECLASVLPRNASRAGERTNAETYLVQL